jgi:hypothetical protein
MLTHLYKKINSSVPNIQFTWQRVLRDMMKSTELLCRNCGLPMNRITRRPVDHALNVLTLNLAAFRRYYCSYCRKMSVKPSRKLVFELR